MRSTKKTQPKDWWSRKLQNTPIIPFSLSYALMLSRLSGDTRLNCMLICIIVHINAVSLWIFIFRLWFFFFCLIKKMCVRKQKRASEWKEKARGRGGGGDKSERGLGEISSPADEREWVMRLTERCKHLHTLRQPWSMELMPVAWRIRWAARRGHPKRSAVPKGHGTTKAQLHRQPCPMAQDVSNELTAK